MEFILRQQAKAEVQMAALPEQRARYEKQHAEEHAGNRSADKAIQKLITAGMKMSVKQGESIKQLTEAQKVTEVKLQCLIEALRRGANGHGARR
jgi:hypothetical protein